MDPTMKPLPLFLVSLILTGMSITGEQGDPAQDRAPKEIDPKAGCSNSSCHPRVGQGKFVHGPVAVKQCTVCHKPADPTKHVFPPIRETSGTCGACHELKLRETVHKPVAEGQCTACHDPHGSEVPALLNHDTQKALCGECHEQSRGLGKKFVHGPVAAGACSLCHNPHSSFYPHLLDKKGADSCLKCHADMEQRLKGAKFWHRPVSEDCSQCHDPHASDHPFQLREDAQALCLDCHKAKKSEIESATVFHEALTTKNGCKNCHRTHASKFPKLLNRPVIDLCLGCHDRPQIRPDKTVVAAIGKELADSKFLHGPIREGNCSSCHNPHGSKNFRLLRQAYPHKFYAPFDMAIYTLCFSCHDSKVFVTRETTTLTNFRDGDRNLHFLHVNKETKGRTCRACHKTHASNRPKHMAEKVPFGGWDIPINFESLPTGGSCAPGCHSPKTYTFSAAPQPDSNDKNRKDRPPEEIKK